MRYRGKPPKRLIFSWLSAPCDKEWVHLSYENSRKFTKLESCFELDVLLTYPPDQELVRNINSPFFMNALLYWIPHGRIPEFSARKTRSWSVFKLFLSKNTSRKYLRELPLQLNLLISLPSCQYENWNHFNLLFFLFELGLLREFIMNSSIFLVKTLHVRTPRNLEYKFLVFIYWPFCLIYR